MNTMIGQQFWRAIPPGRARLSAALAPSKAAPPKHRYEMKQE